MWEDENRFEKIYSQGAMSKMEIWVDKKTGVNYLYRLYGNGAGLTVMLDAAGKPLISPEKIDVNLR
jgi:hypothetical protein